MMMMTTTWMMRTTTTKTTRMMTSNSKTTSPTTTWRKALDEEIDPADLEDLDEDEVDGEIDDDLIDLDDEYDTTEEEQRHPPGQKPRRYDD